MDHIQNEILSSRKGLVFMESITALTISLLIVSTLSLTVSSQYQKIMVIHEKVIVHKIMLQSLQSHNFPKQVESFGQKYLVSTFDKRINVLGPSGKTYEVSW